MKKTIALERTFQASVDDVWELWTTKDGIESWWGPDGFSVTVDTIDLRPGGELHYVMTATGAEQIEFMKKAGMPLSMKLKITYTEITPKTRLVYKNLADFIPGVEPYEAGTMIEIFAITDGARMVLTLEPMHDEKQTQLAVMGWENELGKLAKVLAARK